MDGDKKEYFIVTVQDQIVQITNYIVRANDEEHARELVKAGIYAFESEGEIVDTIESEITTVEGIHS